VLNIEGITMKSRRNKKGMLIMILNKNNNSRPHPEFPTGDAVVDPSKLHAG
jgi:hypothetical protein